MADKHHPDEDDEDDDDDDDDDEEEVDILAPHHVVLTTAKKPTGERKMSEPTPKGGPKGGRRDGKPGRKDGGHDTNKEENHKGWNAYLRGLGPEAIRALFMLHVIPKLKERGQSSEVVQRFERWLRSELTDDQIRLLLTGLLAVGNVSPFVPESFGPAKWVIDDVLNDAIRAGYEAHKKDEPPAVVVHGLMSYTAALGELASDQRMFLDYIVQYMELREETKKAWARFTAMQIKPNDLTALIVFGKGLLERGELTGPAIQAYLERTYGRAPTPVKAQEVVKSVFKQVEEVGAVVKGFFAKLKPENPAGSAPAPTNQPPRRRRGG